MQLIHDGVHLVSLDRLVQRGLVNGRIQEVQRVDNMWPMHRFGGLDLPCQFTHIVSQS